MVGGSGTLVLTGGTDISTGEAFAGELRAAGDASVITPVTTLIVAVAEVQTGNTTGITPAEFAAAQTATKSAVGLSGVAEDLNAFNQINATRLNDGNPTLSSGEFVHAEAIQLQNTMNLIGSLLSGTGASAATAADLLVAQRTAYLELAAEIVAGNPIDLTSDVFIETLVTGTQTALGVAFEVTTDVAAAADMIAALNSAVENLITTTTIGIPFLEGAAQVAVVAQTNARAAAEVGTQSALDSVTTNLSGPTGLIATAVFQDVTGAKGTDQADILNGSASVDIIDGLGGDDTISGGAGADILVGSSGNDALTGGDGADQLRGGDDIDTVDYGSEAGGAGVTVDLSNSTATDTFGATDSIVEIENVIGTASADTITGDANDNRIATGGGIGDDVDGSGGIDTVVIDGNVGDFTIGQVDPATNVVTVAGTGVSATLTDVERIEFNDQTINVPTQIAVTPTSVDENADGAVIGTITVTDADADIASITVDDAAFEVVNLTNNSGSGTATATLKLKAGERLNFEAAAAIALLITAIDAQNLAISANVQIDVNDLNDAPDATADTTAVVEDDLVEIDVLANDSDEDAGNTLAVSGVVVGGSTQALVNAGDSAVLDSGATVTLTAAGTLSYNPTTSVGLTTVLHNQVVQDSFQYEVSDGSATSLATVTVDITGNGITFSGDVADPFAASLVVGDGTTGTLTITDGVVLNTGNATIGTGSGGAGAVTVGTVGGTDGGTQWNVGDGGISVGRDGGNGQLTIQNGADVTINSTNGFNHLLAGVGTGSFGRIDIVGNGVPGDTSVTAVGGDMMVRVGQSLTGDNGIDGEGGRGEFYLTDGAFLSTLQFEVGRETPIVDPNDPGHRPAMQKFAAPAQRYSRVLTMEHIRRLATPIPEASFGLAVVTMAAMLSCESSMVALSKSALGQQYQAIKIHHLGSRLAAVKAVMVGSMSMARTRGSKSSALT